MRWIRYEREGKSRFGILEGDRVGEVEGSPFESYERTRRRLAFGDVRLLPPVIPPTFYAAGLNYAKHTTEAAALLGTKVTLPSKPDIGYRANNALIADGEAIVIPRSSAGKIQFEGELVAVIGKKAKHVSEAEALSCVFGYTIGNDISERAWQASDRTLWRAKNSDTFKPMGPWIETEVDLDALVTRVRLNGKHVAEFKTNDMIFGVGAYISAMSQCLTLYPGDVIWMGADAPTLDMVAGDTVEVEITGIGVLRNPIVAER
jgi:2-keto-4-pentenoate hydratase/2-oxohepta-3-ene-1,7-dioic acid hydratase in catechol pathway